jgi:hypothetical protein
MTLTQQIKAVHTSIRVSPTRPNPRQNEPNSLVHIEGGGIAQKETAGRAV